MTTYTPPIALNAGVYTDLGAGPMKLELVSTAGAWWLVSDTQPPASTSGNILNTSISETINTTSHVWAMAINATAAVVVTPISASGGGGGGGAITVADGADVAQGTTTDAAGASTTIGQLKAILAKLATVGIVGQASTAGDSVVTGGASAATVVAGGTSGYAVNDTITINDGGSTHAVLKVTSVASGVITGVSIVTAGLVSAAPSNPVSQASTSGAGVGTPTFTMTWAPIAQTLFGGNAPVNGWKVGNPNASGDLWVSDNGVTPAANGASSYRVFAAGGQYATEAGEKPPGSALQIVGSAIGQPFIARRW